MTQLDEDVKSFNRQMDERAELEQRQRKERLFELVERYVINTVKRKPAGTDPAEASKLLRNLEYDETFMDWGDPDLKKFRVHAHIAPLLHAAGGNKELLADCFDRALESHCPIPEKKRKLWCWAVRITKSHHSAETTVVFKWGFRPAVVITYEITEMKVDQKSPKSIDV